MLIESTRLTLNLIVSIFKAFDQFIEVRDGYFKFLTIVTLIISQVVNLERCLKNLWNFPGFVVTREIADLRTASVPLYIR